jgi:hypothetical protein
MLRYFTALVTALLVMIAFVTAVPAAAQSRCPARAVTVTPSDWEATVYSNDPGTVYCFEAGTYVNFSVTPKDGDQFYSEQLHGAVLDGNQATITAFLGIVDVGDVEANVVDVRVDGFKLVGYVNDSIWGGGDFPNDGAIAAYSEWVVAENMCEGTPSKPMTACITIAKGNWGCAEDVMIASNIIRGMTHLAILGNMIDGEIVYNVIQNNGWGSRSRVVNGQGEDDWNNVEWNGVFKITNNEVASWRDDRYDCDTEGRVAYVGSNLIEMNRWACIWSDVRVVNFVAEHNTCRGNSGPGLLHEISGSATLQYNFTMCNNWEWNADGWPTGEVVIWDSRDVTVASNRLWVCGANDRYEAMGETQTYTPRGGRGGRGIVLLDADRGGTGNVVVSGNEIIVSAGAQLAVVIDSYTDRDINATFTDNIYYVNAPGRPLYDDLIDTSSFANWQRDERDTGGSETTTPGGLEAQAAATATPQSP